jgi:hypothetical protein
MAGDVEVVISAQDQASSILERVSQSASKMASNVTKSASQVVSGTSQINVSFASLLKAATAFGAIELAAKGVVGVFSGLSGAIGDFDKAQEAVRGLSTAITLAGGDAEASIDGHVALADALEKTTNVEAEVTLGLMKQASALGVADEQLDAVAQTAIGLSEAMGIGLDDALKKARLATEGNFDSFNKLIPSMADMATNEEKLAAVTKLASDGLIQKTQAAGSAAGAADRAANAVGNLMEMVGSVLSPIKALVAEGLIVFTDTLGNVMGPAVESAGSIFESLVDVVTTSSKAIANVVGVYFKVVGSNVMAMIGVVAPAKATFEDITQGIGDAVTWMAETAIAGLTLAEVTFGNFGKVVETAGMSIALSLETMRADAEQTLTVAIPAYAAWFAENWTNLIQDAFNASLTVVTNFGTNLGEAIQTIWDFVSSGMAGGIEGLTANLGTIASKSLLDGFEATTKALPEIASRAMTETEKSLQDAIGQNVGDLASEFSDKYNERIDSLNQEITSKPIIAPVDLAIDKSALDAELSKTTDAAKGKAPKDNSAKDAKDAEDLARKLAAPTTNTATESRLLSRGPSQDKTVEVAANTAKSNEILEGLPESFAKAFAALLPKTKGPNVELVS